MVLFSRLRWAQPLARALAALTSIIVAEEPAHARLLDPHRLSDPESDRLYAKPSAPPPPVPDKDIPLLRVDLAALNSYELQHADLAPRRQNSPSLGYDIAALNATVDAARIAYSPPLKPSAVDSAPEMLALLPRVNGVAGDHAFVVERDAQNHYRVPAGELRALRIKASPGVRDDERIDLATLPGLTVNYVEASQSLDLKVPDALLTPVVVNVGGRGDRANLKSLMTAPSIQLSYRMSANTTNNDGRRVQLAGDMEFVGTSGLAVLVSNGTAATGRRNGFVRGETFFRVEDPVHVRTYTLGDLATGALNFTRSVRLGGMQIQSNFQERPDLFRGPLPQFAGSAALPSALDLYVDGLKIFNGRVPQGPFVVNALPSIGGNQLKIVTTDATGRQAEVTAQFFDAPGLLRKGLVEYSFEVGAPRLNAGLRSFDYVNTLFTSATMRYGLTNRMTLESHAEAGDGLFNGGLGVVRALGALGSLSGGASFSRYRGMNGAHVEGVYRLDFPRFSAFAATTRNYGQYFDLGDVSAILARARERTSGAFPPSGADRSAERVGITVRPAFDPISLTFGYSRVRIGDNSRFEVANLGFTRRISRIVSLRGDAALDLQNGNDFSARLALNFRFGRFGQAITAGDYRNHRFGYSAELTEFNAGRENALGYTIRQSGSEDGAGFRGLGLNYRLPQALVSGGVEQSNDRTRLSLGLEGSLVAAAGDVFLANRIGNGFAIVRNAGAGTQILQNGRRLVKANASGTAFLPVVLPFSENRIGIDPASLPAGVEPGGPTEFRVVPARRNAAIVDFGVRKVLSAIVVLNGPGGKPLPPGTMVLRDGLEPDIMGYDGEVYMRDLQPRNRVTVRLNASESCTAEFDYREGDAEQPRIGPVQCK